MTVSERPSVRDFRTDARYWRVGEDRVRVETPNGAWGLFDARARWIEGPLTFADLHMCGWVGGHHAGGNMSILSGRARPADDPPKAAEG
jgi:hypothetical protein